MRFLHNAIKRPRKRCIEWPFGRSQGYGIVQVSGKREHAHRVALSLHLKRPILKGMQVAHAPGICHNRACINPAHLREATVAENHADKVIDGTHGRGERCPSTKLTEKQVLKIRVDTRFQRAVADEYGVSIGTISSIQNRHSWAWL